MHEPDQNEEDEEEIEDPEVDEHMETGIRISPQRHEEDDAKEEAPYDEEPDVADYDVT